MKQFIVAFVVVAAYIATTSSASAFCGFYVSGEDEALYNNATRVTLMRDGKRTVLAMQNNYEGPPQDFAMVVPVPVVLNKHDVRTLDDDVFRRVDRLSSPRLVEYWERDPCFEPGDAVRASIRSGVLSQPIGAAAPGAGSVKVESEFEVGEYSVVVLSSSESSALESWLDANNYNIPDGAAAYLKPYVQKGQYFFVAKVNMDKVTYRNGEAMLSPIRFHYDSDDFVLPVRLGLINSKGAQDLIAFILARNQRYEVANFPNVTIPTNIAVKASTKEHFGDFYRELFDRVLTENPQAVITEYSWNVGTCDPCPTSSLSRNELMSLGADVVPTTLNRRKQNRGRRGTQWLVNPADWTLTRLHTRYGKHTLGEDLVFRAAPGISGGRGMPEGKDGALLDNGAEPAERNQFQARYVIRHFREGKVECNDPKRGVWSGRSDREDEPHVAGDLGFSDGQAKPLSTFIDTDTEVDSLEHSLGDYDEVAGDPVERWGKLVEPPESDQPPEPAPEEMAGGQKLGSSEHADTSRDCSGDRTASVVLLVLIGLGVCRRFELASSSRLG